MPHIERRSKLRKSALQRHGWRQMNDASPVLLESDGEVITITLNRPDSLNSLDYPMALALRNAIDQAAEQVAGQSSKTRARVVVLRGAGTSFCGGGDVAAMHEHRDDLPAFIDRMIDAFHGSVLALARLQVPVVASVRGAVAGGGFSLALACDLVIAARNTRFVVAYPKLGAPADGGLSFQLTQRLGPMQGFETLNLHGTLAAEKALSLRLINRIVDDDSADAEAQAWARDLAAMAEQSVNELKGLVTAQSYAALQAHLAREKAAFLRCAATPDFVARVAAFVAKQRGAT
ncbi:enoyl-CoA hydratase-related protein [soil metagenome]